MPVMHKKIIAILLVTCVLGFVGCGKKNATEEIPETVDVEKETPAAVVVVKETPGIIQEEGSSTADEPIEADEKPMIVLDTAADAEVLTEPTPVAEKMEADTGSDKETEISRDDIELVEGEESVYAEESEPEKKPEDEPGVNNSSCGCEYEKYLSMDAAEQEAYMNSFASVDEFIVWSMAAQAEHAEHDETTNVDGGNFDIGQFMIG